MSGKSFEFRDYERESPSCPVKCVTPDDGFYIHNFFDVCPWSPSGRYLVCIRLPFQDHPPEPDDRAEICVVDLEERTIEDLYATTAWGMQTGAHQQWGRTDDVLYFNDKRDGLPTGVRFDLGTRTPEFLDGPIYHVAPDETCAVSPAFGIFNHLQLGYTATLAPELDRKAAPGAPDDNGLWRVDLGTGEASLLYSFRQVYELIPEKDAFEGYAFYGHYPQFNRQGTRVSYPVMALRAGQPPRKTIVTSRPDGSELTMALRWQDYVAGHHPCWHPDGERITMNLVVPGEGMRFHIFNWDGTGRRVLVPNVTGSGHPSVHPGGRFLLTDAYPRETVARDDLVPIRLVDLERGTESAACWMWTMGQNPYPERNVNAVLRVDPHPAWSRDHTRACFTGAPDGRRQLYIVDLRPLLVE
ncbi:MAG: TolB family protein [Planctomycetota bacterium]